MGKVIAIVGVIWFVWVMYPRLKKGEFIAPTAVAPNTWMADYLPADQQVLLATPPQGYGWFRFDFWNREAPLPGRPVYRSDFKL